MNSELMREWIKSCNGINDVIQSLFNSQIAELLQIEFSRLDFMTI